MDLITRRGEPFEYFEKEDKLELYSVSQIRKVAWDPFAGVDPAILEAARQRGSLLHRRFFFCLAYCAGVTDHYPARIPALTGYCDSMDRWIDAAQPIPRRLEEGSVNRRYLYAGTVDAHLLYQGRTLTVTDLKSGGPTCTDAMQLMAYDHLEGFKSERHLDIYLDKDGGMPKEVFVPPQDRAVQWAAFLNALSLLRWRQRYGR